MYFKILLYILFSLTLTGCSYFSQHSYHKRDKEYLTAQSVPPLSVPPGITLEKIQTFYPVSSTDYPESAKKVNLTPPGLNNK